MTGLLRCFMNYGLVAAVLVWAAVVGLMAYHLEDSPWRWTFVALAAGGLATVGIIFKIRKYVDGLGERSHMKSTGQGRDAQDAQNDHSRRPPAIAEREA